VRCLYAKHLGRLLHTGHMTVWWSIRCLAVTTSDAARWRGAVSFCHLSCRDTRWLPLTLLGQRSNQRRRGHLVLNLLVLMLQWHLQRGRAGGQILVLEGSNVVYNVVDLVVWLHNKVHFSLSKTFSILYSVSACFLLLTQTHESERKSTRRS
jgi:hypothetical protein